MRTFKLTPEFITPTYEVLANLPWVNVVGYVELLKNGEVTESQLDNMLGYIQTLSYREVGEYFVTIQPVLQAMVTEATESTSTEPQQTHAEQPVTVAEESI